MTEFVVGPLVGYRVFKLANKRLRSLAARYTYRPGVNVAKCRTHHAAPDPDCRCGFWVYRKECWAQEEFGDMLDEDDDDTETLWREGYGDFGIGAPTHVLGRVKIAGRVRQGLHGWRAEKAVVDALLTKHADRYLAVCDAYGIGTVLPRTKEEQGFGYGFVMEVVSGAARIMGHRLDDATGWFQVPADLRMVNPPSLVAYTFEARDGERWLTGIAARKKET